MWQDFKSFMLRGNVLDLAVAVVIGAAFGGVVKSLVDDVIMPPLGLILGRVNFSDFYVLLKQGATPGPYPSFAAAKAAGAVTINYGLFLNTILAFLIVAAAIFVLVRIANRAYRRPAPPAPNTKACPLCATQIPLAARRCPNCTSELGTPVMA
ncbi:MAG: large conductance mechanosensitive channel protein MscL [Gemmatimonadales bacterium]|jgi:large conductance mechanosensitive channel